MNDDRRFEREAQRWLEQGPTQAPEHTVQAVLTAIATTRQERGLRAPWRSRMISPIRAAALAAALLAIGLGVGPLGLVPAFNAPARPPMPPTTCPSDAPLPSGSIATIAGGGPDGSTSDDGPATSVTLGALTFAHLAVAPDGSVFLSEPLAGIIHRIGTDGAMTTFAGPSTGAPMTFPVGLAFDAAGDLLVADPDSGYLWKVDPAGDFEPIAGNGTGPAYTGDEGPAISATVVSWDVAVGPEGNVYVNADGKVRVIDQAGIIHRFGGTFAIPDVGAIGVDPSGNVLISDYNNNQILKVDQAGVISTVAGTGKPVYSGDGTPAIDTDISLLGLAVDDDGTVYFADFYHHAVRKIGTDGLITTVAGTGTPGFAGDCGPAVEAQLSSPGRLAVHDGVLYIVDEGNRRVRMIVP